MVPGQALHCGRLLHRVLSSAAQPVVSPADVPRGGSWPGRASSQTSSRTTPCCCSTTLVGIHHQKIELRAHRQVLLQYAALEDAEALVRIARQPQVHARFEILQLRPAIQNALERHFQVGLEEEGQVGQGGEIVDAAHPFRRAAAHHVAREGGEDVAVAQHDIAGPQQRHQVPFVAIREIRRMDEAEGGRRQQLALLALAGGGFDQLGGIPFAEIDLQLLEFEPAFEEVDLRGFPRAIQAFHRDEAARETKFGECFH